MNIVESKNENGDTLFFNFFTMTITTSESNLYRWQFNRDNCGVWWEKFLGKGYGCMWYRMPSSQYTDNRYDKMYFDYLAEEALLEGCSD